MKLADRLKEVEKIECSKAADPDKPLMVRIDGRCFSKFTQSLARPFNLDFIELMNETAKYLMKETDAKMAYTQSDEITLSFFNDKENNSNSEYMFGGKFQKLTSVFASMATSYFVKNMGNLNGCKDKYPQFDCRVWNVDTVEDIALNYVWRYRDCIRNSVCMMARSIFSHKQLQGKTVNDMIKMIQECPYVTNDWNKLYPRIKYGKMYKTQAKMVMLTNEELEKIPEKFREPLKLEPVIRNVIVSVPEDYESSILDSERIFKTVNEVYGV